MTEKQSYYKLTEVMEYFINKYELRMKSDK
jgi:hypothetical protein